MIYLVKKWPKFSETFLVKYLTEVTGFTLYTSIQFVTLE